MKTFTDSAGRVWTINLTIEAVKRVKALLEVDLLKLEVGDPPLITRLGLEVILLCDVIYALIKPEAEEKGVSDIQFGQALGGEAILNAQGAFYDELILFFRGLGRSDLARAVETQRRFINLAVEKVESEIEKFPIEETVEKILGEASTSLQESLESIRPPSP